MALLLVVSFPFQANLKAWRSSWDPHVPLDEGSITVLHNPTWLKPTPQASGTLRSLYIWKPVGLQILTSQVAEPIALIG